MRCVCAGAWVAVGWGWGQLVSAMSLAQMCERFKKELDAALNNRFKRFDNTIHILKHG